MGKGSHRRKEDIAKIWDNWDAIFKKDQPKEEPKPQVEDKPVSPEQKDAK